ncbi:TetR/AcrR family transcriptional regulator [Streptomyces indicus]|uniref:DNA-binding transcriptional regulator, AcrR family n=1 Tax=Streptomyces indicus TaxID=417292 RepID=A0A1G8YRU9_9ACTN|nr:TetR/AcrR family transcriptional regulator [Streptomyces indicus]SDK05513.1 DNA-binding transcriptional regulator, AcrR family [Streptomyces indicus]
MPTGVAIRDVREQLFAAAERVLLRDGPSALTSRAVTTEAGCAKGVLHRHFADFDAFLAELVRDRIVRVGRQGEALREVAGTGSVTGHVAGALTEVFQSVAVALVGLITSRDVLRARLRAETPSGVPLLTEATAMLADYLAAEQERGRIAAGAEAAVLAPTLIGAGHLLFADRHSGPPSEEDVLRMVETVMAGVVRDREQDREREQDGERD